ncbi:MAG: molecular chaperone DnaJ [Pirellulales bacterium]|nr:molecular chaperone DnaJ [Pirellulales bacterium]
MPVKRDYYEVLGVSRGASDDEIADRYRDLAMKHHPDRNPGDPDAADKFKEAAEAFDVLSHREKRARYDRYGHAGVEGAGGATHFRDPADIFAAFGDIFGDLFGGRMGGRHRVHRGADVRCQVTVTLQEAARGTTKTIHFRRHRACGTCRGTGARPGTQPETCRYCGGAGRIVQSTGIFSMQTTCPACKGAGTTIKDPCRACQGTGFVRDDVRREVNIPAGVDDNTRLRLTGEGEPSPDGGPPGDCYCFIAVAEHPLFQRDGRHLICQVPVGYSQAALGATIDVPTLDGTRPLEIPAGTQPGAVFTMPGLGMPSTRGSRRGDLLVQIAVEVPTQLGAEHELLLRKLAELERVDVTPRRKSFFEKLKECFVPDNRSEDVED